MSDYLRFGILIGIKYFAKIFYKVEMSWITGPEPVSFTDVRCMLLLNHTSLFEPLFCGALPNRALWEFATRGVFPGADITMSRPIAGKFFKLLSKDVISITRKRDDSWQDFLDLVGSNAMVLMAAEGRMKRPNGLDKAGKKMTVRGGAADVIQKIDSGKLMLAYSGGLHHIQVPGQKLPKIFKTLRIKFEMIDIVEYKAKFIDHTDLKRVRLAISRELDSRRDRVCPEMEDMSKSKSSSLVRGAKSATDVS